MKIDEELKQYIEEFIFPKYKENDKAHNIEHIEYVINRSLKFASTVNNIDYNMVYTIAAYHDIGHHIDAKNHEKVSAQILLKDDNLKNFFDSEKIKTISEAIEDHRASLEYEPRSIYGKIVSSADRNTDIDSILKRTYSYRMKHMRVASLEEIIEISRQHIINKFGKDGYAKGKMYFTDKEYEEFLNSVEELTEDKEKFKKLYMKVNNLPLTYLINRIETYIPFKEQEEKDKELFLEFTKHFDDVLTRDNMLGHITASAFVVNEDLTKTLVVKHNIYDGFVYPGGHADGESNLLSVSIREVFEETGLNVTPLIDDIFAFHAFPIKGHIKNEKYVSSHIHFDVLYLLVAKNSDMDKIRILESENSKVKWIDLEDSYNDEIVDWLRPMTKKVVEKIKRLELKE